MISQTKRHYAKLILGPQVDRKCSIIPGSISAGTRVKSDISSFSTVQVRLKSLCVSLTYSVFFFVSAVKYQMIFKIIKLLNMFLNYGIGWGQMNLFWKGWGQVQ